MEQGGLTRAYSTATVSCIEKANIIKQDYGIKYKINTTYNELKNIKYEFEKDNIKIEKIEYGENIEIIFGITNEQKKKFQNLISKSEIIEENVLIEL